MSAPDRQIFGFGPFQLHLDPPQLYRDGERVSVPAKVLRTLGVLVVQHGVAVSKEDLLAAVWADTIVEESNLSQNIYTIRKLLADDFPGQQPIETIARFGYRFRLAVTPYAPPDAEKEAAPGILPAESDKRETVDAAPAPLPRPAVLGTQKWLLAVAALLVVCGMPIAWHIHAGRGLGQTPIKLTRFTSNSDEDRVTAVALSPDGELVAYADADGVVLRGAHEAAIHSLHTPPLLEINRLAWFPDRLHLAVSGIDSVTRRFQIWKISVLSDAPILLHDNARSATPSHDGRFVAFSSADASEVWAVGASGEGARRIFLGGPGDRFTTILWTNKDDGLLLERHSAPKAGGGVDPSLRYPTRGFNAAYERVDVASGQVTALENDLPIGEACLTSADELIYSLTGPGEGIESLGLWRVRLNPANGTMTSTPERVFEIPDKLHIFQMSCDASAHRIAMVRKEGAVAVYVGALSHEGKQLSQVRRLSLDADVAYPHGWSNDGRSVLYEATRNDQMQIYSQALDRHDPQPLVAMGGAQFAPRLTPDHRWVLFLNQSSRTAKAMLYRVGPEGGTPSPLPAGEELRQFRCPMRAGTCLALTSNAQQQTVFSVLDPITGLGKAAYIAPASWGTPTDWDISPDGSTLVFLSAIPAGPPLHTVLLRTGAAMDIPFRPNSRALAVNWTADGSGFFIATATAVGSDLFRVSLTGAATLLRNTSVGSWSVESPDGSSLAFVDRNLDSNVWFLDR